MNLGENIYRLRAEKNMSQGDLADALEVSRQSVSKWENNSATPELDKLKAEAAPWSQQDEDVLSYAMFGQVAVKFFEKRRDKQNGIDNVHADKANKVMPV